MVSAPLTIFLAKLIGLYCVLFGLAMVAQKEAMLDIAAALMRNGPVLLIVEVIAVTAGLAMAIGHNVWSGGALPVLVTLLGWIMLIRGRAPVSVASRENPLFRDVSLRRTVLSLYRDHPRPRHLPDRCGVHQLSQSNDRKPVL